MTLEQLHATPLIGSIEDHEFVKQSFQGSDAVYLMIPPNFSAPDYKAFTIAVGKNYARAIQEAGISYVVNLSSSGSPLAGQPPLANYQNLEIFLDEMPTGERTAFASWWFLYQFLRQHWIDQAPGYNR